MNTAESRAAQPSIADRLDACLARIAADGETPVRIFLTDCDRERLNGYVTRMLEEANGPSNAVAFPLSYPAWGDGPCYPVSQSWNGIDLGRSYISTKTGLKHPLDL